MQSNYCCSYSTHNMRAPRTAHGNPRTRSPIRSPQCFCQSRCNIRQPSSSPRPHQSSPRRGDHRRRPSDYNYNDGRHSMNSNSNSSYGNDQYSMPRSRSSRDTRVSRDATRKHSTQQAFPSTYQLQACLNKCISPESNYAMRMKRMKQQQKPPPTPPSYPSNNYYTCSYSTYSYEDEDMSEDMEDMCSCPCCAEDFDSPEDGSVYDSVAEDSYCMCNNQNNYQEPSRVNNERPDLRYRGGKRRSRGTSPSNSWTCPCNPRVVPKTPQEKRPYVDNKESATQSVHSSFQDDLPNGVGRGSPQMSKTVSRSTGPMQDGSSISHNQATSYSPLNQILSNQGSRSPGTSRLGSPRLSKMSKDDPMLNQLYQQLNQVKHQVEQVTNDKGDSHIRHNKVGNRSPAEEGNLIKSCMKGTCPFRKKTPLLDEAVVSTVDYADPVRDEAQKGCERRTCKFRQQEFKQKPEEKPKDVHDKSIGSSSEDNHKQKCPSKIPTPCSKRSCAYCRELLKKLQQHKEEQHDEDDFFFDEITPDDVLTGNRGPREGKCINPKCEYQKSPGRQQPQQPQQQQPEQVEQQTSSDSNHEATLSVSSSSKPSSDETGTISDKSNMETKGTQNSTKVCINKNCHPRQKSIEIDIKRCINPQCKGNQPRVEDKQNRRQYASSQRTSTKNDPTGSVGDQSASASNAPSDDSKEVNPSVAEFPAVKEHVELKDTFRTSPRSNNVLGPQEERPTFYYATPMTATTFNTNYIPSMIPPDNKTKDVSPPCPKHKMAIPASATTQLPSQPSLNDNGSIGATSSHNSYYSPTRMYSALPPLEEVSKEESETTSDTISSNKIETKCEPTQISTNKAQTTMSYNVAVQYPSSIVVDDMVMNTVNTVMCVTEKQDKQLGFAKHSDYKTSAMIKPMLTKSRRCLVHSYPLKNRKGSPSRATSPKI